MKIWKLRHRSGEDKPKEQTIKRVINGRGNRYEEENTISKNVLDERKIYENLYLEPSQMQTKQRFEIVLFFVCEYMFQCYYG